ncbi:MAG: vitamin K epoxide reductase family protein [Acidobacteriota bacterium]
MTSFAIILAAVGLYIAAYFVAVYYGVLEASTRLMPRVCRLEERTCQTVLHTPYARVFGVPNSVPGVLYYVAVIVLLATGWGVGAIGVTLVAVAWFTVLLGFFLAYSLLFIIRIPCPLCLTAHTINLALALLLTLIVRAAS